MWYKALVISFWLVLLPFRIEAGDKSGVLIVDATLPEIINTEARREVEDSAKFPNIDGIYYSPPDTGKVIEVWEDCSGRVWKEILSGKGDTADIHCDSIHGNMDAFLCKVRYRLTDCREVPKPWDDPCIVPDYIMNGLEVYITVCDTVKLKD